ncbi:recombinase zinc beta ribbon domain-containing protein [Microbacterium sp. P07]|uniref:recombinase zinc beta ribbon domain-containing protein n=1 Tax=Microbacterium sp. P07 TaxID=3366952 RepID=UPI0037457ABE
MASKIAFELFATGNYSIPALADELYLRGLKSRATRSRPAGQLSDNQLLRLLQDPYYLGLARYKDQLYEGRHDALVDGALYARVQEVVSLQSTGERQRTHHHYLKGSLFCGRCDETDETGWMVLANVNARAGTYEYFFCRRRQEHLCDSPYIQSARIESAIEQCWMSLKVTPGFLDAFRRGVKQTVEQDQAAARSLHRQLSDNLTKLDAQEQNLLDLAADGLIARDTIRKRITAITKQRAIMSSKLDNVEHHLAAVLNYIDAAVSLLERPGELYAQASDETRRAMNQSVFSKLFIYADEVTRVELREPFDAILDASAMFGLPQKSTPEPGVLR